MTAARSCRRRTPRSRRASPRSGPLAEVPRGASGRVLDEDIVDRYLDTVAGLAGDGPRDLRTVYTPLHGVGGTSVLQVLETAGFEAPSVVEQQEEPDPEFPTVAFPNPEEPGAMDLAMALAETAPRRPGRRQRPGRRPVRGRRPEPARVADAARRRGRRAARPPPAAPGEAGHVRLLDRLVVVARQDGGRARAEVRRDAHRLQVDQPRARTWPSATRRRSATASIPST